MAIFIEDSKEPFAPGPSSKPVILAESPAYYRLCGELERYALGETLGRSFLISGHRGSGKSTLMLKTVEDTATKLRTAAGLLPFRVHLHGPDLLPAPVTKYGRSSGPADDTHQVLKQITIGIYRSLASALHRAYTELANSLASSQWSRWKDLPELAAQLRIELDGAPDIARLREFWMRAGALSVGVLPLSRPSAIGPGGYVQGDLPAALDRGLAEIVALSSAAQAFRVVSGTIEAKQIDKLDTASKQSIALQTISEIKNLLNPVIGLLAGGAVGYTVNTRSSPILAALAGTAAAVGTTVTLNYSSSRTRESSRSTEVTFLPDNTINALDRMLPLLVERCRRAGLAPVFVVDELDKVEDLIARMGPLINHLKYFVTERSFFCFLADRSYLEEFRRSLMKSPYGKDYTYFSDRLFVVYRPEDLHNYLTAILRIGDTTVQEGQSEALDLELLPYVLLHRSRMHPFDLRWQLLRFRDARGAISINPGAIRSKFEFRFDVLIQVAIEWLLWQPELADRLQQDEDFTQLVYDTLYYPSRMWELGEKELDISEAKFFAYLAERMSSTDKPNSGPGKKQSASNGALPVMDLSDRDTDILRSLLRQLVGYMADWPDLRNDVTNGGGGRRFRSGVLGALPTDARFNLLQAITTKESSNDRYLWLYQMYGVPAIKRGVESILTDELERDATLIERVRDTISNIASGRFDLNRLAVEFKILSGIPAWTSVQLALRRLRRLRDNPSSGPYPEMGDDANAIWEYAQLLRSSGDTLACAIIAARLLGEVSGATEPPDKILAGLDTLTKQLGLDTTQAAEIPERVLRAARSVISQSFPDMRVNTASLILREVDAWDQEVHKYLDRVDKQPLKVDLPELNRKSEAAWRERFSRSFRDGTTVFDATSDDLFPAAARTGLAKFLRLDLGDVSLAAWSNLLISSLTDPKPNEADLQPVSMMFGMPSFFHLGFQRTAATFVENVQKTPPSNLSKQVGIPEQTQQLNLWIAAMTDRIGTALTVRPAALVIVLDRSQFMRRWKPSTRYAAVLVDRGKLTSLRDALTPFWHPSFFNRILIEMTSDSPDLAAQLQSGPSAEFTSSFPDLTKVPITYVFPTTPSVSISSGISFFVGSKSLEDVMARVTVTTSPPSAA